MAVGTPAITNFTAGEWSTKMEGRVDLSRYGQACSELLNMTIMPHGAVTRRMGTEFVAGCDTDQVRLIPFVFNREQAYVVEITPGRIRFFRSGGYLAGKDIASPYTPADIAELAYCQSADVVYLVCHAHAPHKLTRPGPDTFELEKVSFIGPPDDWVEGNWPCAVTFHQQRLWMGGTPKQAQKLWASKTGEFENFTVGLDEADGLALALVSEQVNAIRWMLSQKKLLVGTAGGEWALHGGGYMAITNKNIQAERNSNYGTAAVRPFISGVSALHVSADGRRLRDLRFDVVEDSFLSSDISLAAEHLTRPGIVEIADCQNPDSIIWCLIRGGALCGCTYMRSQEVVGWHRHATLGEVLSICCIPADGFTETWIAVRRGSDRPNPQSEEPGAPGERTDGGYEEQAKPPEVICIERFKAPWDGTDSNESGCWYVDSGLLYEGNATMEIRGLEHLEGQRVKVLADGAAHPDRVVEKGGITLTVPAKRVLAGLPYTWAIAPMRLEGLSSRGTMQGKKARITEVTARLYKSLGVCWELPGQSDPAFAMPSRDVDMPMDAAPLPFSGDVTLTMPGGWQPDARVRLCGGGPFPVTVTMLVPKAVINE